MNRSGYPADRHGTGGLVDKAGAGIFNQGVSGSWVKWHMLDYTCWILDNLYQGPNIGSPPRY